MADTKPTIVLLSLEKQPWLDEMYGPLFAALKAKASVTEVTTKSGADEMFAASTKPDTILATDAALTHAEYRKQRDAAVKYVREAGGTLILGGIFPSFARPPDIKTTFAAFGLPWESGDYHRTEFSVNNANTSIADPTGLAPRYSQKALHLQNVEAKDAVYLPTASSYTQSAVFAPGPVGDRRQTPAALGACGEGRVGYVGDVNAEVETERVVMAMCGLSQV